MRPIAFVTLLLSLTVGCDREVPEPPESPDLLSLRAAFNTPDGRLDEDTGLALVESIANLETEAVFVDLLGAFFTQVVETLQTAEDDQTESTQSGLGVLRSPLSIEGGAWARLRYICGPPGVVDEARYGRAVLNMILDDPELLSVYWGDLTNCVIEGDDGPVTLNSAVILDVSNAGTLMVSMDGVVRRQDGEVASALKFSLGSDRLSFVTSALGQSFVVSFGDDGSVAIRDCAGDWSCDLETRSCQFASAGGTCDPIFQEVNWP